MDTDFELFRSLEDIICVEGRTLVVCHEHPRDNHALSMGFIASIPEHPSLVRAVREIRLRPLNRRQVNQDTGPFFWKSCVNFTEPGTFKMETTEMYPVYYDGTVWPKPTSFRGYGNHHWHHSWK